MITIPQPLTNAASVSPDRWPQLISALGGVLGLVLVIESILVWLFGYPAPGGFLAGVITSVPFIVSLIYGGYWLTKSSISPSRYGRLAGWVGFIMGGFTVLIVGVSVASGSLRFVGYLSTIRWAASIGGGLGFIIGMFNARALDRAYEAGQARASEKEIRRELDLYEALFDAIPEPAVRIRLDDQDRPIVREVNAAFEGVFGYKEADIKDRDIDEFILPDRFADESEDIKASTAAGDFIQREVRRQTAFDERDFLFRAKPLPAAGESTEAVGIYVDLSEQKQRERELERYETIIEALGDPVYVLDADARYTFVNEAYIEQTGYTREEIIGEHVSKNVPEQYLEQGQTVIEDLLKDADRQSATWELQRRTADGDLIPVENHVALLPMEDGEFRGSAGVVRDITERKQRERTLKRQNERLDQFATVVSHDLRNPLNVAAGRLALATEDCDSEHLQAIDRALARMDTLIEDMLSLAKAGETVKASQAVELPLLSEICWQNVETNSARLLTETEATIQADRTRLQQLLENLFRNAIEHGGNEVTVTVGDLPSGFFVEDDGPGIPEDERDDVLEPGYSTDDAGTGFGLGIVRDVAEAHGWEIDITSGPDGGARFEFTGIQQD